MMNKRYLVIEQAKLETIYEYDAKNEAEAREKYQAGEEASASYQTDFQIQSVKVRRSERSIA